jgi:hypothetical protein
MTTVNPIKFGTDATGGIIAADFTFESSRSASLPWRLKF